jgi:hypothetical protein
VTAPAAHCRACGRPCGLVDHHFPTRRAPDDRPFRAALYFSDPYLGGADDDYCGAECSARANPPPRAADKETTK